MASYLVTASYPNGKIEYYTLRPEGSKFKCYLGNRTDALNSALTKKAWIEKIATYATIVSVHKI